jgi:hypothetical protein
MKEFGQPDKEELEKYQQFIDCVLWGGLQYSDGPQRYGVRKSLFYWFISCTATHSEASSSKDYFGFLTS